MNRKLKAKSFPLSIIVCAFAWAILYGELVGNRSYNRFGIRSHTYSSEHDLLSGVATRSCWGYYRIFVARADGSNFSYISVPTSRHYSGCTWGGGASAPHFSQDQKNTIVWARWQVEAHGDGRRLRRELCQWNIDHQSSSCNELPELEFDLYAKWHLSPVTMRLVTTSHGTITVENYETGAAPYTFKAHSGGIENFDLSPNGNWLVSSGNEARPNQPREPSVRLWQLGDSSTRRVALPYFESYCQGRELRCSGDVYFGVQFSPSGQKLLININRRVSYVPTDIQHDSSVRSGSNVIVLNLNNAVEFEHSLKTQARVVWDGSDKGLAYFEGHSMDRTLRHLDLSTGVIHTPATQPIYDGYPPRMFKTDRDLLSHLSIRGDLTIWGSEQATESAVAINHNVSLQRWLMLPLLALVAYLFVLRRPSTDQTSLISGWFPGI